MTPLEMTAKAARNFEAAKVAQRTWLIGLPGKVPMYEVESKTVALSFLTRHMVKQGYVAYKA